MELNRQNIRKILGIVAFGIVLYWGLQNFPNVAGIFRFIMAVSAPFLLGICIAFILNVPMRLFENKLLGRVRIPYQYPKLRKVYAKLKRPLALVLSIVFVLGIIFIVLFLIIPELGNSIRMLQKGLPAFINNAQAWLMQMANSLPEISQWISQLQLDWSKIGDSLLGFLQYGAGSLLNSTVSVAANIFSGIVTFILGFIFALYILLQKEKLSRQMRKLLYAFLPEPWADRTVRVGQLSQQAFSSFITGQCTEAVILGLLFFITMSIFRFPYALMISILIGFLSLIPIFGAFIGCFLGAFVILIVAPIKALWFVIMFLILQQIEGNLIYPKVVGNSVGLPSIWVLVAVTIGGSTMGIVGMLINIPLFSVLYTLLRETVYRRLKEKKVMRGKLI